MTTKQRSTYSEHWRKQSTIGIICDCRVMFWRLAIGRWVRSMAVAIDNEFDLIYRHFSLWYMFQFKTVIVHPLDWVNTETQNVWTKKWRSAVKIRIRTFRLFINTIDFWLNSFLFVFAFFPVHSLLCVITNNTLMKPSVVMHRLLHLSCMSFRASQFHLICVCA